MTLFVALGITSLLLVFAIAVDVGNWFLHKRALQNQVDAAALAGGDLFAQCFGSDPSAGFAAMTTEAQKYDGVGGPYNPQIGGSRKGVLTVLYNSKTYEKNGPPPDDTPDVAPYACTPPYMFDVKGTDADIPLIFGGLGFSKLSQINAHARVELRKEQISSASLPLAVPNVNPKTVTATFIDTSTGNALTGCAGGCVFPLAKGFPSGTLAMWSGAATIPVPAAGGTKIGVRIGLATAGQGCAGTSGGAGFVCYDNSSTRTGLAVLRTTSSGVVARSSPPILKAAWPTTLCAGSPFFSDFSIVAPATTCGAGVQAIVDFGTGSTDPTLPFSSGGVKAVLQATVNGVTADMSYSGGVWSTSGAAFGLLSGLGPLNIDLHWEEHDGSMGGKDCTKTPTPGQCKGDFSSVQQLYSGSIDGSGPVQTLSVSEAGASNPGAPYSIVAGRSHTLTVTVGLSGSLKLTPQTVLLRLTGGSRTSAVQCDGTGANAFRNAIINGCTTPYQLNASGLCPDPSPPAGPADCIPLETGDMTGPTRQGLNTRFASCPANNWPSYDPDTDPRIMQLMVTDFSYLGGSGDTSVPVVDFGEFYITGWQGASCANNQPWPFAFSEGNGDIWGHFIKDVPSAPSTGGIALCDPDSITPCVPVLTK